MSGSVDKRVAFVTGASRGIGKAIAGALLSQGRYVVLVARGTERLEAVQEELDSGGNNSSVLACDVSDAEALTAGIESIAAEHKRLDIVVNNAGITRDNLMLRMSEEEFDTVIATNLKSAFVASKAALRPMMRGKWGRIVNIASVAGLIGNPGQANYAAAKSGLIGLTRSIAREMSSKNITANVVAPGFIDTDMTSELPDAVKDHAKQVTPLRRFGQADEIAAAVAYFTSEGAGFTTGQVLAVDGGMTMC